MSGAWACYFSISALALAFFLLALHQHPWVQENVEPELLIACLILCTVCWPFTPAHGQVP